MAIAAAAVAVTQTVRLVRTLSRGRHVALHPHRFVRRRHGAPRVLVVDDSAGAGVGATSAHVTIAARLGQRYPALTVGNLARNGSRTRDVARVLARLGTRVGRRTSPRSTARVGSRSSGPGGKPYRLIAIHTGGNDVLHFEWPSGSARQLDLALRRAGLLSEHTLVVTGGNLGLAPGLPRPLTWLWSWWQRRLRQQLRRVCAEHHALYVDLYRRAAADPTRGRPRRFFAADGVHPSGANYRLWFRAMDAALRDEGGAAWMATYSDRSASMG